MSNYPYIILYDGVCALCQTSVKRLIKMDKKQKLRYLALQSPLAHSLINKYDVTAFNEDSIILINQVEGKLHIRSTAILKALSIIGFPYSLLSIFQFIPKFFRDGIYKYIGKNRYKWFGKTNNCMLPTPEIKSLFLD